MTPRSIGIDRWCIGIEQMDAVGHGARRRRDALQRMTDTRAQCQQLPARRQARQLEAIAVEPLEAVTQFLLQQALVVQAHAGAQQVTGGIAFLDRLDLQVTAGARTEYQLWIGRGDRLRLTTRRKQHRGCQGQGTNVHVIYSSGPVSNRQFDRWAGSRVRWP